MTVNQVASTIETSLDQNHWNSSFMFRSLDWYADRSFEPVDLYFEL